MRTLLRKLLAALSIGVFAFVAPLPTQTSSPAVAATPPMGWNSWDGYGTTVNEEAFKANAQWLAKNLRAYGWNYVTVDMEWFVTNPTAEGNSKNSLYTLDTFGRFTPAPNRFPSAKGDAGFKPLADAVHALGLKFGIHILRGIPKGAVEKNLPIAGSSYRAGEAADMSDTCPWNPDNYGVKSNAAGQAYYDSIAKLYAQWGVDLIKVDCIASHPYKPEEIRMLSKALQKTGRAIGLSLSPGAAPRDKADEMAQYAQMWRISDDIWDIWHSDVAYPQGLGDQFANVEKWAGVGRPGRWPDADMLPLGFLGPAPGWGKPRWTRLSHDEQRTLMSLWCIFPSPLMVGGDLTQTDAWTLSLLTNKEVLEVDQQSTANRVAVSTDRLTVWVAEQSGSAGAHYVAAFNRSGRDEKARFSWKDLKLEGTSYRVRDLWEHRDLGEASGIDATIPGHGVLLYQVAER